MIDFEFIWSVAADAMRPDPEWCADIECRLAEIAAERAQRTSADTPVIPAGDPLVRPES